MGEWIAWGIVVFTVWVAVAVIVGLLIGRVIRGRDQQAPADDVDAFPAPRTSQESSVPDRRSGT